MLAVSEGPGVRGSKPLLLKSAEKYGSFIFAESGYNNGGRAPRTPRPLSADADASPPLADSDFIRTVL